MHSDITIEALIINLHHPDPLVQLHAAANLGSNGSAALAAVPVLVDLLAAEAAADRKLAAWTLGEIGPAAEVAVAALLDAAHDPNQAVREMVLWALEQIDRIPGRNAA